MNSGGETKRGEGESSYGEKGKAVKISTCTLWIGMGCEEGSVRAQLQE